MSQSSLGWLAPGAVAARLQGRRPRVIPRLVAPKRAAVAVVLRWGDVGPEVLLMQRVERQGDRWSGQVSFPGGKAEPEDGDLLDTALREMREEVGLDLPRAAALGRSDDQVAMARGKVLSMAVTPHVLRCDGPRPELALGPEAAAGFWLPLAPVVSGELDGTYVWRMGALRKELPCWHYQGRTVWGLTHAMLSRFIDIARPGR